MRERLREIAEGLITPAEDYAAVMRSIEQLYQICAPITGVLADKFEENDIYLPTGKAISPTKAARCIKEVKRTAVFVRGVYEAIRDMKARFPEKRVEVLYAGCGPYATLLLPMSGLFGSDELGVHLLDIHPQSIEGAARVYHTIGLSDYLLSATQADATKYQLPASVDIVVSETMMHALVREPQVAIMQHLLPQLPPHGVFVPESISVSAQLLNDRMETDRCLTGIEPPRVNLGNVYTIGRTDYRPHEGTEIGIGNITTHTALYLVTDIQVYGSHTLGIHDSSLNLPVAVDRNVSGKHGRTIRFQYQVSKEPGFLHEWL